MKNIMPRANKSDDKEANDELEQSIIANVCLIHFWSD